MVLLVYILEFKKKKESSSLSLLSKLLGFGTKFMLFIVTFIGIMNFIEKPFEVLGKYRNRMSFVYVERNGWELECKRFLISIVGDGSSLIIIYRSGIWHIMFSPKQYDT